jgi:hypothetical protein
MPAILFLKATKETDPTKGKAFFRGRKNALPIVVFIYEANKISVPKERTQLSARLHFQST